MSLNHIERTDTELLTPFKLFVLQNFPFIEEDFDSLTNYEIMSKMVEYMNNISKNLNILSENDIKVFAGFNTVVDYINNYFDNLDVQVEINNKLDNMASDGTLTDLISNYVTPYIENQNNRISTVENLVRSAVNNSPHPAGSISDMTNTDYIYVLTDTTSSDYNKWFYYDESSSTWKVGGVYQAITLGENSVDTNNLNTQFIDKVVNIGYEQNGTMHRNYNQTYNDVSNHILHYVDDVDAITVTPGTYFFATKITMLSLTSTVRFRAGLRVDGTDRTPKSGTINDSFFYVEDVNATKMCYGLITIPITIPSDSTSFVVRPFVLFVNNDQVKPISASFTIDESYIIKLDSTDENEEINEMADTYQRITTYSFQKAYPRVHFTENDINKYVLPLIDLPSFLNPIEEDITELQEDITELQNNTVSIPGYIKTETNNYISLFEPPAKSLSLIFQTDHHAQDTGNLYNSAKDSILASNLICDNLPISLNIFGGDYIANSSTTLKQTAKNYIQKLLSNINNKLPNILLRGNHECNQLQTDDNELLTDLEIFNLIGKKYITNKLDIITNNNIPSPMYGYVDFPFQKIRVVFVNTSDGYDQNLKIGMGNMNRTQLQWLADNAFDLTDKEDYQVIVFGHYPIYDFDDETSTIEQGRLEPFKQLLLAFKNGTNLNYTTGGINYTVIKDFRTQGAKTLIAYVCGHVHDDKSIVTTDGLLQISTTNAGLYGKDDYVGTADDFAFDVITIDTINKNLKFDRIGYGNDRTFTYE